MAEITLRNAKPDDARSIAEIHIAAWRAAYRGLMPDDFLAALNVDERTEMWSSMLSRPSPSQLAVSEIDRALVGFCSYGPTRDDESPDLAEIYALNVHPDRWSQGAGRALCEHAYREAATRGHTLVSLWVMSGNARARRFYERLGYAVDGASRSNSQLIGRPFDEVRYRKVIA
ncbi:MAG: GNAT family N-acetyltransferase [Betaproteobacteria bacterium]|nr:GNAT family N-acetyltransferase [Betaproteobacteria bacterium]